MNRYLALERHMEAIKSKQNIRNALNKFTLLTHENDKVGFLHKNVIRSMSTALCGTATFDEWESVSMYIRSRIVRYCQLHVGLPHITPK